MYLLDQIFRTEFHPYASVGNVLLVDRFVTILMCVIVVHNGFSANSISCWQNNNKILTTFYVMVVVHDNLSSSSVLRWQIYGK